MAIYVSQAQRKEKKKSGGFSMLGSLLMLAGTATGNPMLTVAGAGMTAADTIARGADPMETVSGLTQIVGGVKQMQQQKASQSDLNKLVSMSPEDRSAFIMGQPTGQERQMSGLGQMVGQMQPALRGLPTESQITGYRQNQPVSPVRSQLQASVLAQGMKPRTLEDERMDYLNTLSPEDKKRMLMGSSYPKEPKSLVKMPTRKEVAESFNSFVEDEYGIVQKPTTTSKKVEIAKKMEGDLQVEYLKPEQQKITRELIANRVGIPVKYLTGGYQKPKIFQPFMGANGEQSKIEKAITSGKIPAEDIEGIREILRNHPEAYKDILKGYGL